MKNEPVRNNSRRSVGQHVLFPAQLSSRDFAFPNWGSQENHCGRSEAFVAAVTRARVLIADDHAVIADAFTKLLSNDFDVIASVHDGRSLISESQRLRPDVILVDIGMPLLNGLEAALQIKQTLPEVRVIYITVNHDEDLIAEAFRRGASGYLPKTASVSELVEAIRLALRGDLYLSPKLCSSANISTRAPQYGSNGPDLTQRQIEVLQLLAEGKSMKEVASVLSLTTRTVAFHKYRIMEHLQLGNDAELIQYAVRHHVVFG
jgi:DNA-binding NarL/FixJ family response regulator